MKLSLPAGPLAIALAVFSLAARAAPSSLGLTDDVPRVRTRQGASTDDWELPDLLGAYIVEFEDVSAARTASFSERSTADQHAAFHEHLAKREEGAISYDTRYSFTDSRVFVGVSVQLQNPEDVTALHDAAGVKAVYPVQLFRPLALNGQAVSHAAAKAVLNAETFAPHVMTQVDRLHREGFYGKGATIGILDAGIDYTHPALNGGLPAGKPCFGKPECTVIGGTDLVGDNYTGTNQGVPDDDPFADCDGSQHGTHVAGTAVGNDTTLGFTGVAPQAKVRAYRMFGCASNGQSMATATDVIIGGIARAFADKVDVISISIGSAKGFVNSPGNIVASRISALGVPVVVASGNSGTNGAFYAASPGSAEHGVNVASVQSIALLGFPAKITGITDLLETFILTVKAFSFYTGQGRTLPVYVVENACYSLPNINLDGKVVISFPGPCRSAVQQRNIYYRGGRFLLYATPVAPNSINYNAPLNDDQQFALIAREDASKIQATIASGKNVTITFNDAAPLESRPNNADGGLPSSSTNFGPTNEMFFTPHVAAPGGVILSAFPVARGSYGIYSGTSMAAPFISGLVAQYIAINGRAQDDEIRSRLMSHSKPLPETNDINSPLASVGRVGAGLVQAYDSLFATATASPAQLALNDSTYFVSEHFITIKNIGKTQETYTTTHLPAGTAQTGSTAIAGYTAFASFPIPLTTDYASVDVSPAQFVLAPGASKQVKVTVKPPPTNQDKFPVYSGFVKFVGSTPFSSLSVPYLGLAAAIAKRPVLDSSSQYFQDLPMPGFVQSSGADFPPGEPVVDLSTSSPLLIFRLTFGSPVIDIALVPVNTTFDASIKHGTVAARSITMPEERMVIRRLKQHGKESPAVKQRASAAVAVNPALFNDVVTNGTVLRSLFLTRNTEDVGSYYTIPISNQVTLPNGSGEAPEGRYRVLLRAQRVFADPTLTDSYESFLTEPFTYRKKA